MMTIMLRPVPLRMVLAMEGVARAAQNENAPLRRPVTLRYAVLV
jgi:hypothetical protein